MVVWIPLLRHEIEWFSGYEVTGSKPSSLRRWLSSLRGATPPRFRMTAFQALKEESPETKFIGEFRRRRSVQLYLLVCSRC